jgi:uncharacterized DUF497 family protein
VEIRDLVWDEENTTHLEAHGIEWWEVDEVTAVDAWAVDRHPDYPHQVRIIGPTLSGRMLTVALEPMGRPGSWRPITGWDATAAEITYYREQTT